MWFWTLRTIHWTCYPCCVPEDAARTCLGSPLTSPPAQTHKIASPGLQGVCLLCASPSIWQHLGAPGPWRWAALGRPYGARIGMWTEWEPHHSLWRFLCEVTLWLGASVGVTVSCVGGHPWWDIYNWFTVIRVSVIQEVALQGKRM